MYTVDRVSGRSVFAQDTSLAGALAPLPFTLVFNVDKFGRTVENAALPMFWGGAWGFARGRTTRRAREAGVKPPPALPRWL